MVGGGVVAVNSIVGTVDMGTKYPIPRSTQRVIARLRAVYSLNGAVVQEFQDDIIYA